MKKIAFLIIIISIISGCCAFAAKYKVNTNGVIKSQTGNTILAPANTINQNYNYYNNYSAQNYVANNQVNFQQVGIIEIVMDYSGSMANWIWVAKRSMASIVAQIPYTTRLGFRVFGHDSGGNNPVNTLAEVKKVVKSGKKFKVITERGPLGSTSGACSATQQVASVVSANGNSLITGMNSVNIGGATPLVYALDRTVYQDFSMFDQASPKKIVLITDGGENCGGDPCEFARRLMAKRNDVHIDVVLVSSNSKALTCLASTTGGHFYKVDNLSDFSTTISNSIQSQPLKVPQSQTQNNENYYEFIKD